MNIKNIVKQVYELEGAECRGAYVYINNSDWQNMLELSTRFFPKTFNDKRDVILRVSCGSEEKERYTISCQISYNQGAIPVMIGLAVQSIEDETRQKDLERTVKDSKKLIIEVEETGERK